MTNHFDPTPPPLPFEYLAEDDSFHQWLKTLSHQLQTINRLKHVSIRINSYRIVSIDCPDDPDERSYKVVMQAIRALKPSAIVWGYVVWLHAKNQKPRCVASRAYNIAVADRSKMEKSRSIGASSFMLTTDIRNFDPATMTPLQDRWRSRWASHRGNLNFLLSTPGIVTIHSEEKESGYPYLAIKLDRPVAEGGEKRLNKPVAKLLGAPIETVDTLVASVRTQVIERAIATGGTAREILRAEWKGHPWKIQFAASYLGDGEIAVISTDADLAQQMYNWKAELEDNQIHPLKALS